MSTENKNPWDFLVSSPIISEDACLALMDSLFPSRTPHVPQGRGDDCAELQFTTPGLALSTDYFWQDIHFRTRYFTPEEAGAKALTIAVSDLAGAGAVPLGFSLGLMLPPALSMDALRQVLSGMAKAAERYGIVLSGGDLSRGASLGFCITVWGEPAGEGAKFLRRGGAAPGDVIFLVGEAGLARVGLWALEHEGRAALAKWPAACTAHLKPRALLAEGGSLARLAGAAGLPEARTTPGLSLLDVSDGLVRDLPRLLGGLGADVSFDSGILHPEVAAAAAQLDLCAEEIFLAGGEDYSLLGSCAQELWPHVRRIVPGARVLGLVTGEPGLKRHGVPLRLEGFDHFADSPAASPRQPGQGGAGTSGPPFPAAGGLSGPISGPTSGPTSGQVSGTVPARRMTSWGEEAPPTCGVSFSVGGGAVQSATEELIQCCRAAWKSGLMAGFNGNASCRVALAGGEAGCLVTRSGAAKGMLTEKDVVLVPLGEGEGASGGRPSSETPLHLAVYAARPEARAILHTHPPYLLALCLALPVEQRLRLPLPEARAYAACLAFAPALAPGSAELARAAATAAAGHDAVWLENHGLVVHGPDLLTVLALTEELEHLAKVQLLSKS